MPPRKRKQGRKRSGLGCCDFMWWPRINVGDCDSEEGATWTLVGEELPGRGTCAKALWWEVPGIS